MKKSMQILSVVAILCIFSAIAVAARQPISVKMARGEAVVTALEGSVQITCEGQKKSRSLKLKDNVKAGCEIVTGEKSRLEMVLPDKSIVRFAENTRFNLIQAEAATAEKREIKIFVKLGKIWSNVRKALGGKSGFEVSCENAVAGVRGTIYRVNVEDDKSALVKVYDGEVRVAAAAKPSDKAPVAGSPKPVAGPTAVPGPKPVSMEEWVHIVKTMQQIRIQSNGKADDPQDFTEAEDSDEWVDWNKSRDRKIK